MNKKKRRSKQKPRVSSKLPQVGRIPGWEWLDEIAEREGRALWKYNSTWLRKNREIDFDEKIRDILDGKRRV